MVEAARPAAPRTAALALGALGVVYGDIGTNPLFALQECFSGTHALPRTAANVLGVLSLVFWALVAVVSIRRGMWRWQKRLFAFLSRNAQSAPGYFGMPPNRVVEIGMQVEI